MISLRQGGRTKQLHRFQQGNEEVVLRLTLVPPRHDISAHHKLCIVVARGGHIVSTAMALNQLNVKTTTGNCADPTPPAWTTCEQEGQFVVRVCLLRRCQEQTISLYIVKLSTAEWKNERRLLQGRALIVRLVVNRI